MNTKQLATIILTLATATVVHACPLDFTNNSSFTFVLAADQERTHQIVEDKFGELVHVPVIIKPGTTGTYPSHSGHAFYIFRQPQGSHEVQFFASFLQKDCFNMDEHFNRRKHLQINAEGQLVPEEDAADNFEIIYS